MTDRQSDAVFLDWRDLPPIVQKHLEAIEMLINDVDGKEIDDEVIDADDAVEAVNGLVRALRKLAGARAAVTYDTRTGEVILRAKGNVVTEPTLQDIERAEEIVFRYTAGQIKTESWRGLVKAFSSALAAARAPLQAKNALLLEALTEIALDPTGISSHQADIAKAAIAKLANQ